ncbi:helix-turn-helix domain-containing protein [Sphingomonas sp. GM_Shp_2]|uniref:helix-turn-helix domain-containing protein n=1 Tax=Sphingomonas sp. GM_Shp_2 TaxID=2937380 RepID=UPI002269A7A0|nr:helix-turn-helix domain-containing protein [Sphingomonas sp. GM_Shp_2]
MSKTIAFLAETRGSATIEEQQAAMSSNAHIIVAGRQSFNKLGDLLARSGLRLEAGDRVSVYDLSCIMISTGTLLRIIGRLLRDGVAFEIVTAGIVIGPAADDKLHALVRAFDSHQRYLHGLKTRPETVARGRKPLLDPEALATIRTRLAQPGATATSVAKSLGVSRSTLFNFLERHERGRRLEQEGRRVE